MNLDGIKNIIFDLDGTLVDSSEGITAATNYALAALNEPTRAIEDIKKYIGYPLESMCAAFTDKPFPEFWKHFRAKAREIMADSARPLDGADIVIKTLHERGYRLAIGSTKISPHILAIARKLNWFDKIDVFVGADDVDRVKPAPDAFLKAMRLMGGNPENTIVIGDTVNDIYAAREASLKTVAVKSVYGNDKDLLASNPDIMVDHILELLSIFK